MEDRAAFRAFFEGRLYSLMSWDQLTAFWQRIEPEGWYLYAVGEEAPTAPAPAAQTGEFVRRIDALLRDEHRHDYCAIVYADDIERPSFVKIYDPNNLGSACGVSSNPPLPGWIMSRVLPEDLQPAGKVPAARRRWWQAIFG
jgi:hypothetical protein